MLRATSYLYKGRKITVRADIITNKSTSYIDSKVFNIMDTLDISLLTSEAESQVDKEIYGNIHNVRA